MKFSLLFYIFLLSVPATLFAQEFNAIQTTKYDLELEPNLEERSLAGTVRIYVLGSGSAQSSMTLNVGDLEITTVLLEDEEPQFSRHDDKLVIELPKVHSNREQVVQIDYNGTPRYGMKFSEDATEVSTAFSTSQWMPSIDSPSERASYSISLIVPAHFKVAAPGRNISTRILPNGKQISTWSELEPMPAYLYGFAAGEFIEVIDKAGTPTLRFLAPPNISEEQLARIFRDTRSMISFFEEKSGVSFPNDTYSQVLLRNGSGQELDDMAVMGEGYGTTVLSDETAIWLGAHEIAHQWWGNMITNQDWTHFWLNEGLVNFMTASYLGHRFGPEFYDENISAAQEQYLTLVESGRDKPLVFPDWDNPSREDRSIVYDKGAYVIHLLKEFAGEESFWEGVRFYTSKFWGQSVTTLDFQTAMEQTTGKDLDEFFDSWVY